MSCICKVKCDVHADTLQESQLSQMNTTLFRQTAGRLVVQTEWNLNIYMCGMVLSWGKLQWWRVKLVSPGGRPATRGTEEYPANQTRCILVCTQRPAPRWTWHSHPDPSAACAAPPWHRSCSVRTTTGPECVYQSSSWFVIKSPCKKRWWILNIVKNQTQPRPTLFISEFVILACLHVINMWKRSRLNFLRLQQTTIYKLAPYDKNRVPLLWWVVFINVVYTLYNRKDTCVSRCHHCVTTVF